MAEYWLWFLGCYLLGGISLMAVDYVHGRIQRRRQAKILAHRLSLLREYAEGKRVG